MDTNTVKDMLQQAEEFDKIIEKKKLIDAHIAGQLLFDEKMDVSLARKYADLYYRQEFVKI